MATMVKFHLSILILFLLIGCDDAKYKTIAKVPEASGISYCTKSNTLVVASDEGTYYEMDSKGDIISKINLGKYDLEGVVCEDDKLIFAVENKGLLIVDKISGTHTIVPVDDYCNGKELSLFDKKSGVEGIEKVGNRIYLSKQSKEKEESFIAVIEFSESVPKTVGLIKHNISDIAGLAYYNGSLYMVSDKEDLLIKYNITAKKIVKKNQTRKRGMGGDSDRCQGCCVSC